MTPWLILWSIEWWDYSAANVIVTHSVGNRDPGVQFFEMATVAALVRNTGVTFKINAALKTVMHFGPPWSF